MFRNSQEMAPVGGIREPGSQKGNGFACVECGCSLTGMRRKFCSDLHADRWWARKHYVAAVQPPLLTLSCAGCCDKFESRKPSAKWCSKQCMWETINRRRKIVRRQRATRRQAEQACIVCGAPIAVDLSLKKVVVKRVCSRLCHVKAYQMREKGVMLP